MCVRFECDIAYIHLTPCPYLPYHGNGLNRAYICECPLWWWSNIVIKKILQEILPDSELNILTLSDIWTHTRFVSCCYVLRCCSYIFFLFLFFFHCISHFLIFELPWFLAVVLANQQFTSNSETWLSNAQLRFL